MALGPQDAEVARREKVLKLLRGEYILSHENVSQGILNGTESLPENWINQRLGELGEAWHVGPVNTSKLRPANIPITPGTSQFVTGNLKQRATDLADEIRTGVPKWEHGYDYIPDIAERTRLRANGTSGRFRFFLLPRLRKLHDEFGSLYIRDEQLDQLLESDDRTEKMRIAIENERSQGAPVDSMQPYNFSDFDLQRIADALTKMAAVLQ